MTLRIVYTILSIAFFVVFVLFLYDMTTDELFGDNGMFILVSLMIALAMAMTLLRFIALFIRKGTGPASPSEKRTCASCGHEMDANEHACPECRTMQPSNER